MRTIDEIGKSLKNLIYISDPRDGFFITIPGRTDLIGQVFIPPEYKNGKLFEESIAPSIDDPRAVIELYSATFTERAIYLTPTSEPANRWATIALMNCYGGLDVLNSQGKDLYVKIAKKFICINPVVVPIRKNIELIDLAKSMRIIKEICQIKSENFLVSPHFGRQCFQIYFSYKKSIVDEIKAEIPKGNYSFKLENFAWNVDFSCHENVVKLLSFIDKEFS